MSSSAGNMEDLPNRRFCFWVLGKLPQMFSCILLGLGENKDNAQGQCPRTVPKDGADWKEHPELTTEAARLHAAEWAPGDP